MALMMELQETVVRLDDSSKMLLLEIAKKFLDTSTVSEDELTESDLTYIQLAEAELANGETTSHIDIDWS